MEVSENVRGFRYVDYPKYLEPHESKRLIQESSAIGDYEDSFSYIGSSFLWFGEHHHLNREEVRQVIIFLQHWLDNGRLPTCGNGAKQNGSADIPQA